MKIVEFIKSLKISIREKIYSVNNFSLLDILNYLFRFKYLLSALIFIFYIINAINGLNIDYKALLKIFEEYGFRNLMNSQWGIGLHYLDDINGNIKENKNSISNNIYAANNNDNENSNNHLGNTSNENNDNPNQNERGSSPVDVTNIPRYISPIEGANDSSDENDCDYSSDEGAKIPSEENGFNPEYNKREVDLEGMKLGRRYLRLKMDDVINQRNGILDSMHSKLKKAKIFVETKTVANQTSVQNQISVRNQTSVQNQSSVQSQSSVENQTSVENHTSVANQTYVANKTTNPKRSWEGLYSDSDSDNYEKSKIIKNESVIIKTKKAKFMDPADKKDFQDTLKIVEKKSQKLAKLAKEYDDLGEKMDDCESNLDGKMNSITKGLNNVFNKK